MLSRILISESHSCICARMVNVLALLRSNQEDNCVSEKNEVGKFKFGSIQTFFPPISFTHSFSCYEKT
jgi:hypothetical protein